MSNIKPIETISAQELLEMPLEQVRWLVEGIITTGLTLLAGSPKVGKSWFSLLLALCVSEGKTFLDHATEKGEVLYLCLEDTFPRIQQRLFHLTDEASNRLHFAVMANKIKDGLVIQLKQQLKLHPELRLVIIDTLQTVRNPANTNSDAYAADYGDLGTLKAFADENSLCLVLVHHTRKMRDETNVFNMVLGGNGLMGTADTTLVLVKENFFDDSATLSVTGRDVDLAEFKVEFVDCRWTLIEQTSKEELEEREIPSSVLMVIELHGQPRRQLGRYRDPAHQRGAHRGRETPSSVQVPQRALFLPGQARPTLPIPPHAERPPHHAREGRPSRR